MVATATSTTTPAGTRPSPTATTATSCTTGTATPRTLVTGTSTEPLTGSAAAASHRLHGALAAAVTPFDDGGGLDIAVIEPLVDFYARSGLDGVLVLGTTGEGVLLSVAERRTVAEEFIRCADSRLAVAVHCGAQSTRDTAALCEHAAGGGAAAIAVIPPPYYALDDDSILHHLVTAASACAPAPFYVYEFAARSGYAVPVHVIEQLRARLPNMAGL